MIKTKAFVFDFDDTLAFTDAKVHVRNDVGRLVVSLTPQEFNEFQLHPEQVLDFSDFDKASLILNGKPTKLIELATEVFREGRRRRARRGARARRDPRRPRRRS